MSEKEPDEFFLSKAILAVVGNFNKFFSDTDLSQNCYVFTNSSSLLGITKGYDLSNVWNGGMQNEFNQEVLTMIVNSGLYPLTVVVHSNRLEGKRFIATDDHLDPKNVEFKVIGFSALAPKDMDFV